MRYIKIILFSLLLTSCSKKVAFTSQMQEEYNFPESKLKKVQFYTSDEIVLVQTKSEGDVVVVDGKLIMRSEKAVEKIIIKKNTPCVLEEIVDNNKFLYSFEYGDNRVILFGNDKGGYYSLMAKEWKNKVGEITYSNKKYLTVNGDVYLKIKVKNLKKLKGKQRTVKGRKI